MFGLFSYLIIHHIGLGEAHFLLYTQLGYKYLKLSECYIVLSFYFMLIICYFITNKFRIINNNCIYNFFLNLIYLPVFLLYVLDFVTF